METRDTLDEVVRERGFESEAEFHKMVAIPDLDKPSVRERFKVWQHDDGTKKGLQEMIDSCAIVEKQICFAATADMSIEWLFGKEFLSAKEMNDRLWNFIQTNNLAK